MRRIGGVLAMLLMAGGLGRTEPVPTRPPELLRGAPIEAPPEAVAYEADVKVVLHVDATGHVSAVDIPEPVGPGLDDAARAAGMQYLFRPGEVDGVPAPALYETVIRLRRDAVTLAFECGLYESVDVHGGWSLREITD